MILRHLLANRAHLAVRIMAECEKRPSEAQRQADSLAPEDSQPITLEQLVARSAQEAFSDGSKFIGTEHFLIALLDLDRPIANAIGIRLSAVRAIIHSLNWRSGPGKVG